MLFCLGKRMKVIDLLWTLNLKTRTKLSYGRKVNSKLYCTIFMDYEYYFMALDHYA